MRRARRPFAGRRSAPRLRMCSRRGLQENLRRRPLARADMFRGDRAAQRVLALVRAVERA